MANLQVSSVKSTDTPKAVIKSNTVNSSKKTIIKPNPQQESVSKKQIFLEKINSVLDTPYLKTSVKNINGKNYLCVTRPASDIDRQGNNLKDITIGELKRKFGLKDNIIKNNNNSLAATGRNVWSDSATLDKNATISIPLEELGQEYYFFRLSENKILKQAVQEYQK